MAFKLNKSHIATLTAIATGTLTHISKADGADLAANGYIEVNAGILDDAGNAAVRLTDAGKAAVPETAPAANTSGDVAGFTIIPQISLPTIDRGGSRESKYKLHAIPLGGAAFIPAANKEDATKLSKRLGSVVAEFNRNNTDKYLTTRTLSDGGAAGMGDAHNGKPGVGIYHRPVEEKKVRKSNKTA